MSLLHKEHPETIAQAIYRKTNMLVQLMCRDLKGGRQMLADSQIAAPPPN